MVARLLTAVLLLVCAGLGFLIVRQAELVPAIPDSAPLPPANGPVSTDDALLMPGGPEPGPPGQYELLLSRPLFDPSRRPAGQPVAVPEPPPQPSVPPPEEVVIPELLGIMKIDDAQLAYLKWEDEPKPQGLRPGDDHKGWKLVHVGMDRVVIERKGQQHELAVNWKGPERLPHGARPPGPVGPLGQPPAHRRVDDAAPEKPSIPGRRQIPGGKGKEGAALLR